MDFYVQATREETTLFQGDLLEKVPFSYFQLTEAKVVIPDQAVVTLDLTHNPPDVAAIVTQTEFGWGMVMNQTCDLQPNPKTGIFKEPILISRVRPIKDLVTDFDDSSPEKEIRSVRLIDTEGKRPTLFYLPAYEDGMIVLPRSGVNLLDMQRFLPENHRALLRRLRLRLSPLAQHAFQSRCSYCLGRFAAPDGFYLSAEAADHQRQERESKGKPSN